MISPSRFHEVEIDPLEMYRIESEVLTKRLVPRRGVKFGVAFSTEIQLKYK